MLNDEFTVVGGEVIENPVKGSTKEKTENEAEREAKAKR